MGAIKNGFVLLWTLIAIMMLFAITGMALESLRWQQAEMARHVALQHI